MGAHHKVSPAHFFAHDERALGALLQVPPRYGREARFDLRPLLGTYISNGHDIVEQHAPRFLARLTKVPLACRVEDVPHRRDDEAPQRGELGICAILEVNLQPDGTVRKDVRRVGVLRFEVLCDPRRVGEIDARRGVVDCGEGVISPIFRASFLSLRCPISRSARRCRDIRSTLSCMGSS